MRDSLIFTALADPIRRDLLLHLANDSPKTATQLAADYPITRQALTSRSNFQKYRLAQCQLFLFPRQAFA
ncbi:MAG: helix-turn-helix transcriptional regulator [Anaerolineae bacterium]|nr:helix-turn-helix transcriptional regulator [Anaerolineae bacterium]